MDLHHSTRGNHPLSATVLQFCIVLLLGCSAASELKPLEGNVTVDGAPLPNGAITFIPKEATGGPVAGASIVDGRYRISPSDGVLTGEFRVEITAMRNTGKKVPVIDLATGENKVVDETAQYIPARYNQQSELTAEVSPQGSNQFDFSIKSK